MILPAGEHAEHTGWRRSTRTIPKDGNKRPEAGRASWAAFVIR
jgi:hypothetical protein